MKQLYVMFQSKYFPLSKKVGIANNKIIKWTILLVLVFENKCKSNISPCILHHYMVCKL